MTHLEFSFGTVELHPDQYIHAIPNEGIELTAVAVAPLIQAANEHFEGPFGLIDDRQNSFSIDYSIFEFAREIPRLAVIAVVVREEAYARLAGLESALVKSKPYRVFLEFGAARRWLLEQLALEDAK